MSLCRVCRLLTSIRIAPQINQFFSVRVFFSLVQLIQAINFKRCRFCRQLKVNLFVRKEMRKSRKRMHFMPQAWRKRNKTLRKIHKKKTMRFENVYLKNLISTIFLNSEQNCKLKRRWFRIEFTGSFAFKSFSPRIWNFVIGKLFEISTDFTRFT